ncbi:MAG TPA: GvpL/GvpF family gas vesicle protein [Ktedonobacteraceae bacterium]|jgi:hypothetical protein
MERTERKEGFYVYGIMAAQQRREFGPIGIGGRGDPVYTLPYRALAALVSRSPIVRYAVTRENSLAHARVLEKAMEDATVLPVRFCTIAETERVLVEKVLQARYQELQDLIGQMAGKIELGVRAMWTNLEMIFAEIVEEHREIKALKTQLGTEKNEQRTYAGRIQLGQLVQRSLEEKKQQEADALFEALKPLSLDWRRNQLYGDMNIINAAFLVDREKEQAFDKKILDLEEAYGKRKKIKYIGPVVPYNFVEIVITW